MGQDYHAIITPQTAWGTYGGGTAFAVPVDDMQIDPGQETIKRPLTGRARGLTKAVRGAKMVQGSLKLPWWHEYMGHLIKHMMFHDVTSVLDSTSLAFEHSFLADDSAALPYLSGEMQLTATDAQFLMGMMLNQMTITIPNKGIIDASFSFLAQDETRDGDNWSDGTTAAPSITASPAYFGATVDMFTSFDTKVYLGGTPAVASGKMSVGSDTQNATIESVTLDVSNNGEMNHTLTGYRFPNSAHAGARDINLKFDADWTAIDAGFYDQLKAGTTQALRVLAVGALIEDTSFYTLEIIIPKFYIEKSPWTGIQGTIDKRTQSVEGFALHDASLGYDIGFNIIDQQGLAVY